LKKKESGKKRDNTTPAKQKLPHTNPKEKQHYKFIDRETPPKSNLFHLICFCWCSDLLTLTAMSATVISDAMVMSTTEPQTVTTKLGEQIEVMYVKCDCCGLTEECTIAYIDRIRKRYQGKWICGLCAEAVKDEIVRCERLISTEDAMTRHMNFCKKFNSAGPPVNPAVHLITAMRQILRRSLDSTRSMPSSPMKSAGSGIDRAVLARSESCFAALSLVQEHNE
jgi:hypothetical protein